MNAMDNEYKMILSTLLQVLVLHLIYSDIFPSHVMISFSLKDATSGFHLSVYRLQLLM